MRTNVSIGPASVLGWLAAGAGLITCTVQSIETGGALVSGPGKWPAILGVAVLAVTNLGRQLQAAHLPGAASVADSVAEIPAELLPLLQAAQANAASKGPDGVDSARVAFSREETIDTLAAQRRTAQG